LCELDIVPITKVEEVEFKFRNQIVSLIILKMIIKKIKKIIIIKIIIIIR